MAGVQQVVDLQKEILLSFMEKHPSMAREGKVDGEEMKKRRRLWQQITDQLNSGYGPKKSIQQWKLVWYAMKTYRKKKLKLKKEILSDFDIRLINLLDQEPVPSLNDRLMMLLTQEPAQGLVVDDAANDVKWHVSAAQSVSEQDDHYSHMLEHPDQDPTFPLVEVVTEEQPFQNGIDTS